MRKGPLGLILLCMVAVMVTATMTTSCNKNQFDKVIADSLKKLTFHNDKVDPDHTWRLMTDWMIRVNANVSGVKRIEVLSANPYVSKESEIMASRNVAENSTTSILYSVPNANDSVYVAAVDENEHYTIVAIEAKRNNTVDFTTLNTANSGTFTTPADQEVYYCYSASFPEPSESWGFNDLVMRISKEYVNEYTLRLNVTLQAIGSTKQIAAAIRLNGINYDQVNNISVEGTNAFLKNEDQKRFIIEDEELLLKARDGSAVLSLFDDAHTAFFSKLNDNGTVTRYMFNVSHEMLSNSTEFSPVTVSYKIIFNDKGLSSSIGFETLDPFIAYYYNTARWEVHKYSYKFNETLFSIYKGNANAYIDGFSWALEVPYRWFRYPSYGNSIGSYKDGVIYGAYQRRNHSFGEWGADHTAAQDWYLYPTTSMVY